MNHSLSGFQKVCFSNQHRGAFSINHPCSVELDSDSGVGQPILRKEVKDDPFPLIRNSEWRMPAVSSSPPAPILFRIRIDRCFLFCSFAFDPVEEAWVSLVYVSGSSIRHTSKATQGHTLFLIKNTISAEASPWNLLIWEVTQLPLIQTTEWEWSSEEQKREFGWQRFRFWHLLLETPRKTIRPTAAEVSSLCWNLLDTGLSQTCG